MREFAIKDWQKPVQFSRPMTDNAHTIVVGMMQTPPYDHMFESTRRVYSAKGLCPSCLTHGGGVTKR